MLSEPSANDQSDSNNDRDDHQVQRTWDLNKIGSFDTDTWLKIFENLNSLDLARVATVCKQFQTMAEYVFKKKMSMNSYRSGTDNASPEYSCHIETERIGWKEVVCRFKNCITRIDFVEQYGKRPRDRYSRDVLYFMDYFLSESALKSVSFLINPRKFKFFNFTRTFSKLEDLCLFNVVSVREHTVLTSLNQWCPNLKTLSITNSIICGPHFFLQSLSSLQCLELNRVNLRVPMFYIMYFFSRHDQLKELSIENVRTMAIDMSWLTFVNQLLPHLETMTLNTYTLDSIPEFRYDFDNLKSLSFLMARDNDWTCWGTITNQLLKIIKHLPKIESLRVINCQQNLMTNDDLVELVGQSSSTLKLLMIAVSSLERTLAIGYDLHRKIFRAANNSNLCLNIDFGNAYQSLASWTQGKESEVMEYKITKDGIWENSKLIVVNPQLLNC